MSGAVRIITIAREFASGGAIIAGTLASRLGWTLIDRAFIDQVAAQLKLEPRLVERWDECVDTWFDRTVRALWRGGYEGSVTATSEEGMLDADLMAKLAVRIVGQAADIGNCVIVGRGAQCILGHREATFHTFVYGPWGEKIERVHQRFGASANAAAIIHDRDRRRSAYIRRYFDQDWCDRRLYHMLVDSGIGVGRAAAAILAAAGLEGSAA